MIVTSVSLTNAAGNTVSLLSTPLHVEFLHLNGTVEPLQTVSIPQGVYTSATVAVDNPTFVCNALDATGVLYSGQFEEPGALIPSAVTVSLPAPITITGTDMELALNLLVSRSATWIPGGTGGCPSLNNPGPFSIAPTFELTPLPNHSDGISTDLLGMIASVGASGDGFTVTAEEGPSCVPPAGATCYPIAANGPSWQVTTNANTVYQGIVGLSQLAAGMPVDMDVAFQGDGSLLVTRVAVYDTNTTNLNTSSGPLLFVSNSQSWLADSITEEQGNLPPTIGALDYSFSHAIFQTSGHLTNVQSLPFTASFTAANMVAGQSVFITANTPTLQASPIFISITSITLLPQTLDGTVSAIGSDGSFTTYTITLAPYDLFPQFAVQPGQTTLLTNPSQVVVYADSNTQMLNTNPITVGGVTRFYGLVFNDNGTLRMDASEIFDGVPE